MDWSDPVGSILSCKNRKYLDMDIHFAWQDILMLFECLLFNRLASFFLHYLQPLFGVSSDPVPVPAEYVNSITMPFLCFGFFCFLYFSVCGYFHYFYYMPYGNEYVQKNKVQKERKFVWSQATRKEAGASEYELKLFYKAISTSMKAHFATAWLYLYQVAILAGNTNIYWTFGRKSVLETVFWFAVAYFSIDFAAYWVHRALHWPWLYKHVHKMHHMWKSPTPWVVAALVPAEMLMLTATTMTLLCMIPLWFPLYAFLVLFVFVYNTMDHSGVEISSIWFWQAPVNFHDRHHEHFHVNYGPMVDWWDKLFGSFYYEGVTKGGENNFHDHWESSPEVVKRLARRLSLDKSVILSS